MIDFYSVLASLADENQQGDPAKLNMVANWMLIWADASADVRKNGSVLKVDGSENPKLKVMERAEKALDRKSLECIHRRATAQLVADAIEAEVINGIGEQFDVE